jgi:hypothetical protein
MTNESKGEEKPNSKLTEDKVREMKRLNKTAGIGKRRLAAMFGISESVAGRIISGKAWKHID